MFESIAKNAISIGATLIFTGYVSMFVFYNHWGIAINSYVSIPELSLSVLKDIYFAIYFVGFLILQMLTGQVALIGIERKTKIPVREKLISHLEKHSGKGFVITSIATFGGLSLFFNGEKSYFWLFVGLCIGLLQLLLLIADRIQKDSKEIQFIVLLIWWISFSYCLAKKEIYETEKNFERIGVIVTCNDYLYSRSNGYKYIGRTQTHTFLYKHAFPDTVKVISNSEIRNISWFELTGCN